MPVSTSSPMARSSSATFFAVSNSRLLSSGCSWKWRRHSITCGSAACACSFSVSARSALARAGANAMSERKKSRFRCMVSVPRESLPEFGNRLPSLPASAGRGDSPHAAQPAGHVDAPVTRTETAAVPAAGGGMEHGFQRAEHPLGEEAAARAVDVAVAVAVLLGHVIAQRRDQVQVALRPGHCYVQQSALLLDELRARR